MRHGYPIMLDVADRLVVIVGGGGVAVRKARGVIEAGAQHVRCVAPKIDSQMPPSVEQVCQEFEPGHLDGAGLVFAATDSPEVNARVVREAHQRGLLVNRADSDDEEPGDFAVPAVCRLDPVTIAVSAAGNPALAAKIRDDLAARFDPTYRKMAEAMQSIRPVLLATVKMDAARRREALRMLATPEALKILAAGNLVVLWDWLVERFPELGPERK